uniref:Immunoglobulin V-set domain-containing protein n=1 Tax=Oryzias melastigma TaxID=30732 RepID=A0A3B3BRT9_ORYME
MFSYSLSRTKVKVLLTCLTAFQSQGTKGGLMKIRCGLTSKPEIYLPFHPDVGEEEYVSFRMKPPADPEGRPESFKNRVILKNSQMKDGDLSVVLENVNSNDTGTYQCRILQKGSRRKRSADQPHPISTIRLVVVYVSLRWMVMECTQGESARPSPRQDGAKVAQVEEQVDQGSATQNVERATLDQKTKNQICLEPHKLKCLI